MIKFFKDNIRVLLNPRCWIRIFKTDKQWDKELNLILDQCHKFKYTHDNYFCEMMGCKIWISNYPYAYGSSYSKNKLINKLPSRKTCFMLHDLVGDKNMIEKEIKNET